MDGALVEPGEGEVLLLDLLDDLGGDLLELPHAPVDHLAQRQRLVGQLRPVERQLDLLEAVCQSPFSHTWKLMEQAV